MPLLKILAANPEVSPVIPPPTDIKQSFLLKFSFNSLSKILFTLAWFLFNSLELKEWRIIFFGESDFIIFLTRVFGTLLSITIKHLLNLIELSEKIFFPDPSVEGTLERISDRLRNPTLERDADWSVPHMALSRVMCLSITSAPNNMAINEGVTDDSCPL